MLIESYLIVNYRTGDMKLLKRWPQHIGPYEVISRLKITIDIPVPPPCVTLEATMTLPPISLFEVVLEDILA